MSTIIGTILRADDAAPAGNVAFTPLATPAVDGAVVLCGETVNVTPDADGAFSIALRPGTYAVRLPGNRYPIQIGVPDDSATYDITALIVSELPLVGAVSPAITLARWSEERLREHVLGNALVIADASISGVGATSAVIWPDGGTGTLTITAWSEDWAMATGYTVSHTTAGKLVTQPEVTLNEDGQVTNQPDLTVTAL